MTWCQFKKHLKRPVNHYYFCWPDSRMKSYSDQQSKNNIHLQTRSDSLKQINYKVNLKTLDSQSNYKPHFLMRFISCLTSFGQKNSTDFNIETETANNTKVRAVLNDEKSVCSCQLHSSSYNQPSFDGSSNSGVNSQNANTNGELNNKRVRNCNCHFCKNQMKLKMNNKKNGPCLNSSTSCNGNLHSVSENTTSTMSSASVGSKSSISTIAATAVYSFFCICCVRNRKKKSAAATATGLKKRRRARKKKGGGKITRKCCIKYNRTTCLNNSSNFDSIPQSNESNDQILNSLNTRSLNTMNPQIERNYQLVAHQPNCKLNKDKFYSSNKYTINTQDYSIVGKANDIFLARDTQLGVGIVGLGAINGKIKMCSSTTAAANCHLSSLDAKKAADKCLKQKNLITSIDKHSSKEHSFTNAIFLMNNDKIDKNEINEQEKQEEKLNDETKFNLQLIENQNKINEVEIEKTKENSKFNDDEDCRKKIDGRL